MIKIKKLFLSEEFIKFFVSGVAAFVIDFGLLWLLTHPLNFNLKLLDFIFVPNIISTSIAILCSYIFQKYFAFETKDTSVKHELGKFILVQLSNLILFNVVVFGFLLILNIPVLITKVITMGMQMIYSFVLYKFFVFKKK